MPEPQTSYANGSFTTSMNIAGSNNITTTMRDTLGILILAIISLLLFFELRRMNTLNRQLLSRSREHECECSCHKKETPGAT